MSGYLQRLLDRGAGLAAATPATPAGAEAAPAMASGSPVLGFDQRLAESGLAADFGILGISPDPEAIGEEAPEEAIPAPAPAVRTREVPTIAAPPAKRGVTPALAVQPSPLPSEVEDSGPAPLGSTATPSTLAQEIAAVAERVTRALPPEAKSSAVPAARAVPFPPPPVAVSGIAKPTQAAPVARTPETVTPTPHAFRSFTTPATPSTPSEPVIVTPAAPVQAPIAASMPAAREVEPPLVTPPPITPPASAVPDVPAIERVVREAVRAELARQPAAQNARTARITPANEDQPPAKPAPRPATAREASVIGALEPSASPLTIYGVRRR